jgi:microcystin-dependent protein
LSVLKIPTAKIFEPLLAPSRYKCAFGGRGSGKSHFFGELLVETCQAERGTLAVCIREAQRTLAQLSKRLIESKIAGLGLGHGFKVFSDKIATPGDGVIIFRGMQAASAKYRDDIAGAIVTSGTSTTYAVSTFQVFDTLAHLGGQMIAFTPHVTNGATVTLNVDALGAKPLRTSPGVELLAGTIIQGTPYVATYNNIDGAFYLQGFFGNPYNIPLAGGLDYWAATAPNTSFAFPVGQAISRTTYAALFALVGTTYGPGDGSTTFNLPDKTGRVSAMKEAAASRLTPSYFSGNSTAMGATGGSEHETLITANLPPYTPSGSVMSSTTGSVITQGNGASTSVPNTAAEGSNNSGASTATFSGITTSTFAGSPQGGTSTPFTTVQPTIVCNYILRII